MRHLGDIDAEDLDEIQQALGTLNHHSFFEKLRTYRTEILLNQTLGATDQDLPRLIRIYQAEITLLGDLTRMADEVATTLNRDHGDS